MDRRDFLKILGVTSSSAVISSCGIDKANEKIIPYVIQPEEEVYPGKPLYVNTTCSECPANCGLQVRVDEKIYQEIRGLFPTKLEGVEKHPINLGGLCVRGQAGLFRLYHPDRLKRPMMRDEQGNWRVTTWNEAYSRIRDELKEATTSGMPNVYLSSRTSGTLSRLITQFCQELTIERLPEYETYSHANLKKANHIVFNRNEIPNYRIQNADFLLTVGVDIFETFISPVSFSAQLNITKQNTQFHWFHIEPHVSLTGVQADLRIVTNPESEAIILAYLLQSVLENNRQRKSIPMEILRLIPNFSLEETTQQTGIPKQNIQRLVDDLLQAELPLIISGSVSTAHTKGLEVAVLTSLLQWILGMTDNTIDFSRAMDWRQVGDMMDMEELAQRLDQNEIGVIFISRCDPVGSLPENYKFIDKLDKASFKVALSDCMNETVKKCDLILPLSHSLEAWGDAIPYQGLHCVIQPAIEPQYDSLSEGDILLNMLSVDEKTSKFLTFKDYLFNEWENRLGGIRKEEMLNLGYIESSVSGVSIKINRNQVSQFFKDYRIQQDELKDVLVISPSIRHYDGRSKDLALLNEIPDPLTTISYGKWVFVSEEVAHSMNLEDGDEIEIEFGTSTIKLPAKVQKFLHRNVFLVYRGFIPTPKTSIDNRSGEGSWYIKDISVSKTGKRIALPVLAGSLKEEGRGLLPHSEQYDHSHGRASEHERWYPEHEHKDYRWGMAIDLESCIGCNACVAACYVENNIPLVGRKEHLRGREMSWIRIQPYLENHERIEFLPMMCQHCDYAPCEPVCPVYAAYHNPEGLNVQVYNRCVGTRYCANNCPYKARRFNWFDNRLPQALDKMYNPDVSIRDRGMMEKCTFCIQRIRAAKDIAKDEERLVRDGEVIPACAQSCPTKAITFGNLKDKNSKVYKLAHSNRAYRALDELGTEPAVSYLQRKINNHDA